MSLFRDYLRLLIIVDFIIMKSTSRFPARGVFRYAGRDVTNLNSLIGQIIDMQLDEDWALCDKDYGWCGHCAEWYYY